MAYAAWARHPSNEAFNALLARVRWLEEEVQKLKEKKRG